MTPDNFRIALRAFARRQPFKRFVIEFVSGQLLLVKHPEAVNHRGDVVFYNSPKGKHRVF